MKKITLMICAIFCFAFSWQINAQLSPDNTCSTSFDDISTSGTDLMLSDDGEANITIPFAFTLDGVSSSDLRVGNNGGVLFNATAGNITTSSTPTAEGFYPFADDIGEAFGAVYWEVLGTAPNRRVVILWNDRPHYTFSGDTPSGATFELILYETTNEITFLYQDTDFGDTAYNDAVSAGIRVVGANGVYVYSTDTALGGVSCINWTVPACLFPANLNVNNITSTTADLSWTETGTATAWNIEWGASGFTQGSGTVVNDVTNPYTLGSLTENNDYEFYVQADCEASGTSDWSGPFAWSQILPPSNDDCDNAITLTVNADLACGTVTAGTTVGATASSQADDVTGTPNTDVWFSFVATSAQHQIALQNIVNLGGGTSTSTDMGMGVYDATGGCVGLVFFDDSDPNTLDLTGLTVSNTYYVRVYGWQTGIQYNNFDICLGTPPPPPSNDNCANAITITESPDFTCSNSVSGTTKSANNSADYTTCSTTYEDVWYVFTPSTTGNYSILRTLTDGTATTYLNVWSGSCGALTQVNASCFSTALNDIALTAGTPYYISVASFTPTVDFDLCIYSPSTTVPANDECSTATGFSTLPFNDSLDASAATNNTGFIDVGCGGNGMNDGVWYTFTTVDGGTVDIDVTNVVGWDPEVAIYSGSCGALTCIDRADASGTGFDESITGVSVSAATQYWVNVGYWSDSTDNSEGPFTITISTSDTTTLNLDEVAFEGFKYFPNPVNGVLSLSAQNTIERVEVYNMLGQEVMKTSSNALNEAIDMSNLNAAPYFVKVTIDGITETIRIIKQ